jgi:hypothetical protein
MRSSVIPFLFLSLIGASSRTFYDYSVILAPPMKAVVMQGDFVAAVDAAYQIWLRENLVR